MPSQRPAVEGLRRLCALLSPFSARETLLADWPAPAMWPSIVAQADTHRLIPALAVALDRLDAADRLDPEAAELLARIAAWNADRNEGLRRQVHGLSRAFNAAGLQPVWLKGALALLPAAGHAGGRMMLDLDVWLPDAKD
ncbi:nucleotidyltransferase family protein [Ancylobacter sp.]|uniref:nucleotidyltransferase family protein n=1 Tax=Ancylobacter sp. TaxID=1872567 RepID=UPI003D0EA246